MISVSSLVLGFVTIVGCGSGSQADLGAAGFHKPRPRNPLHWNPFDSSGADQAPDVPEERITELLESFRHSSAEMMPGVVIMPVTDAEGRVRCDGLGLSYQAMYQLARMSVTPQPAVRDEILLRALLETRSGVFGTSPSRDIVRACAAAAGSDRCALVSIADNGRSRELTVVLQDLEKDRALGTKTHTLSAGQLNTVPGLIVADLCELLQWSLTDTDRRLLDTPQVGTDEDSSLLGEMLVRPPVSDEDYQGIERFLRNNPQCLGAWRCLFRHADRLDEALDVLSKSEKAPEDSRLELEIAARFLESRQVKQVLENLLPIPPALQADPACRAVLARALLAARGPEALEQYLEAWRKNDSTYGAHLARGELLLELADTEWKRVRADQSAGTAQIQESIRSLLDRASQELLQAVEINPRDWQARVSLISIATALASPRDQMQRYFKEAIAANPSSREAWRRRLQFLSPWRHGSVDDVIEFMKECIRTEQWDDGIPQLAIEAVREATCDPITGATHYATFTNERLWSMVFELGVAAMQGASIDDRVAINNCLVLWGASGKQLSVAEDFEYFASYNNRKLFDASIFESHARFRFLHDVIFAEKEAQGGKPDASVRLALDAAQFGDAARIIDDNVAKLDRRHLSTYRKATELGAQLMENGTLDLTPDDALKVLLLHKAGQVGNPTSVASEFDPRITSCEGALCFPGRKEGVPLDCYFPVGILHGSFSGLMELPDDFERVTFLLHLRGLRDIVYVSYLPLVRRVSIVRGRREVAQSRLPQGPIPFRFEFRQMEDVLEPVPGTSIRLPVVDDVPSSLGIEVVPTPASEGVMRLRQLHFEISREASPRDKPSTGN